MIRISSSKYPRDATLKLPHGVNAPMETNAEVPPFDFRRVARIKGPSAALMGNMLLTIFLLMVVSTIVLLVLIVVDAPAAPAGVIAFFVCLYLDLSSVR